MTHHVDEIIPEIERVILLRRGRVAFDGSKSAVFTPQRLGGVFDSHVVVDESDGYTHRARLARDAVTSPMTLVQTWHLKPQRGQPDNPQPLALTSGTRLGVLEWTMERGHADRAAGSGGRCRDTKRRAGARRGLPVWIIRHW